MASLVESPSGCKKRSRVAESRFSRASIESGVILPSCMLVASLIDCIFLYNQKRLRRQNDLIKQEGICAVSESDGMLCCVNLVENPPEVRQLKYQ